MGLRGKSEKVCATCIYWRGKRIVNFNHIVTNSLNGKCICENSFVNLNTFESCACSSWRGFCTK